MVRRSFFTLEMGTRLRQIRVSHRLTMDVVAERMGLIGKNHFTMLTRLKAGMVGDPHLRTIAVYLAACGANWTDFVDVLNQVKPVLVKPADAAKVRDILTPKPGVIPPPETVEPVTPAKPTPKGKAEAKARVEEKTPLSTFTSTSASFQRSGPPVADGLTVGWHPTVPPRDENL